MLDGGFLQARKTKPIGFTLILAGHAAILGAIALAPPDAYQRIEYIRTIVTNIRDEPPPPEQLPPPQRTREQPTTPTNTDRLVDVDIGRGPVITSLPPIPDSGPISSIASDPVFVPATIDPAAMARFQPSYPSSMVRAGIEGAATVRVLIGSDGGVKSVELVRATDPAFFEATRTQALRYWRFTPATKDGIAAESWRTMTVKFKLES